MKHTLPTFVQTLFGAAVLALGSSIICGQAFPSQPIKH